MPTIKVVFHFPQPPDDLLQIAHAQPGNLRFDWCQVWSRRDGTFPRFENFRGKWIETLSRTKEIPNRDQRHVLGRQGQTAVRDKREWNFRRINQLFWKPATDLLSVRATEIAPVQARLWLFRLSKLPGFQNNVFVILSRL